MGVALRFFLSGEEEDGTEVESESSDESDTESQALRDMVISRQTVKSGRKRERKVARARAILKVCTYVMCKVRIQTIRGFFCAKLRLALCAIHPRISLCKAMISAMHNTFLAQSMDSRRHGAVRLTSHV